MLLLLLTGRLGLFSVLERILAESTDFWWLSLRSSELGILVDSDFKFPVGSNLGNFEIAAKTSLLSSASFFVKKARIFLIDGRRKSCCWWESESSLFFFFILVAVGVAVDEADGVVSAEVFSLSSSLHEPFSIWVNLRSPFLIFCVPARSPFEDDVTGGSNSRLKESLLRLLGNLSTESSSLDFCDSFPGIRFVVAAAALSLAILFCCIRSDKMLSISIAFFVTGVVVVVVDAFSSFCCTKIVS